MKYLLLVLVLIFSVSTAVAEVSQHSEDSIESDLGFKWEASPEEKERTVASDNENQEENEDSDNERDVASDVQESDTGIQFWKY